nr:outer membrane beta-barrel family protein [uncultured Pedobacter sp.]
MNNCFLRMKFILWITIAPILAVAQTDTVKKIDTAKKSSDTLKKPIGLKEVKIVTTKNFIEQKIDRTVLNVGSLISNGGANALEVLEKAPGVQVDQDGNISLKGLSSVVVLIDNRPTYLSATALAAYLKSLPASAINQIELIPNPPARYDAAGSAGLINIRTKKSQINGLNGSLNVGAGYSPNWRHNGSVDLNYRKNKINVFGNLGYSTEHSWRALDINRWFYNEDDELQSVFKQHSIFNPRNTTPNTKAGMDFYVSDKTTLGFVFTGSYNRGNQVRDVTAIATKPSGVTDSVISALNTEQSGQDRNGINFNYSHKYDSLGRELSFDLDHIRYKNSTDQTFGNEIFNSQLGTTIREDLVASLPSKIAVYSAKGDYEHPLKGKAKLSAGLKTSFVNTDNIADYFIQKNDQLITDNEKTNHFRYKENINAAYVNFNKEWKRFSIQAGLRIEQTNMEGHQLGNAIRSDSTFSQHYTNLFPTLYFSYKLDSNKNKLTLYYGRRVRRPYYQDLNPFIFLIDKFTYFAGNPYIRPEFNDKIDLNFNHDNKINFDIFYSLHTDMITEVINQENGIFISRTGNVGRLRYYGASLNLNLKMGNWYRLNLYSEAVRNRFSGFPGNNGLATGSFYVYVQPNNQFNFNKGWGGELNGVYLSPSESAQFKKASIYLVNVAVQKKFLADKASIKFTLRDVFDSNKPRGEILNIPLTAATYRNAFDNRVGVISFSYNFSKGAAAVKKRNTGGAGNEQDRIRN